MAYDVCCKVVLSPTGIVQSNYAQHNGTKLSRPTYKASSNKLPYYRFLLKGYAFREMVNNEHVAVLHVYTAQANNYWKLQ